MPCVAYLFAKLLQLVSRYFDQKIGLHLVLSCCQRMDIYGRLKPADPII